MEIRFENTEFNLASTIVEYNGVNRGTVEQICFLAAVAESMGYQVSLVRFWDAVDSTFELARMIADNLQQSFENLSKVWGGVDWGKLREAAMGERR